MYRNTTLKFVIPLLFACLLLLVPYIMVTAQDASTQVQNLLVNSGLENSITAPQPASDDIGFGRWQVTGEKIPADWALNSAYPGVIEIRTDNPYEGNQYVRLSCSTERGSAHFYQTVDNTNPGDVYRISVKARRGPVQLMVYEHLATGVTGTSVLTSAETGENWQTVSTLYVPISTMPRFSVAIIVPSVHQVDIDDLKLERLTMPIPPDLEPITLQTDFLQMKLSATGVLEEYIDRATGVNYANSTIPVIRVMCDGSEIPPAWMKWEDDLLKVQFADPEITAWLKVTIKDNYIRWQLERIKGASVSNIVLADIRLNISQSIGTLVNAGWNDQFASCLMACTPNVDSAGADNNSVIHQARCYAEFGMEGGAVAIIGAPVPAPGNTDRLLDIIEKVEINEGLPHLMVDGVWIKRSPKRVASYILAAGLGEANIDDVVEYAKGGFGCVEFLNWWKSTPTYAPEPGLFPNGLEGFKACADKVRAAGMQVGMHYMQGLVGWDGTGMRDPYVSPVADSRLWQDIKTKLAEAITETATEIKVTDNLATWPETGELRIDGELVRYAKKTENGFSECVRGSRDTTVKAHPAGTEVGHMRNVFNMWGNTIYAPDANTDMQEEIAGRAAKVFNAVKADMSYFDGGEEFIYQQPSWKHQGRMALAVQAGLDQPIILSGNALYTHHSWHVITRGSPSFDPMYFGRRQYTLRFKGQNPASWARNMLTGDVGWFTAHSWAPSTDAVTPDEMMLLCLKAVGGNSPISFIADCGNLWANKRMPEMLQIIRDCDEIKRTGAFSDELRREISTPMKEHTLGRDAEGNWEIRPLQFGPSVHLNALKNYPEPVEITYTNTNDTQRPWLRLKARSALASFGSKDNIMLADYENGVGFVADATATPAVTQTIETVGENAPDGSKCFRLTANNTTTNPSVWTRAKLDLPAPVDLTYHRRLGVWIWSEGRGGLLNVQLEQGYGFRDHYIDLNYEGWRYHQLAYPEEDRFFDLNWPHSFVDVMYWPFSYGGVKGVNLMLNQLPTESETTVFVGRIEALQEYATPITNPVIETENSKVEFSVKLMPEEYIEVDFEGLCRHFDRNGGYLGEVKPEGELRLGSGENLVKITAEPGANANGYMELTLATRGNPLPGVLSDHTPQNALNHEANITLSRNGSHGWRILKGLYELATPGEEHAARENAEGLLKWNVNSETSGTAVALITRSADAVEIAPDNQNTILLEDFTDATAWKLSADNNYEPFVVGDNKQVLDCGPVRKGVLQDFTIKQEATPTSGEFAVYSAENKEGAGGWSGIGRRFAPVQNLNDFKAISLYINGDNKGESVLVQFRDVNGAYANWTVKIDYDGWQRHTFRFTDATDFDWSKVEYLLFYFNNIPGKTSVQIGLDNLQAISETITSPPVQLSLKANDETINLPVELQPGDAVMLDNLGNLQYVGKGERVAKILPGGGKEIQLQAGENQFELKATAGVLPQDLVVKVIPQ